MSQISYAWDYVAAELCVRKTVHHADGSEEKVWIAPSGLELQTACLDFQGNELKQLKYYDSYGRTTGKSEPFKGSYPLLSESWQYDSFGRVIEKSLIDGGTENFSYNGDTVTVTKEGITTTNTFDAKGQMIGVSDPKGAVHYKLLPNGQPSMVVASNVTTTFSYDQYGRRTAIVDPSGGTRSFAYNNSGLLSSKTDADGRTISTSYDSYGRVITESMPGMTTSYTYDSFNRLTAVSSSNSTGYQCTYDSVGRIASRKDFLPDNKFLLREYTYSNGNLASTRYTNQNALIGTENYQYAYGVMNQITFGSHDVWQLTGENDRGQHTSERTAYLTHYYLYDDDTHLSSIRIAKRQQRLWEQLYTIDPSTGNLSWRKDNIRGLEENFEYDAVNRLTSYSGNRMMYDDLGNVRYKEDANLWLLYNNESHPYTTTGIGEGFSSAFVRTAPQRITYNAFECPDSIIDNGIVTTFVYNAAGDRVKMKTSNADLPDRYYVDNIYMEHITASSNSCSLFLGGDVYSAPAVYVVGRNGGTLYYIGRDHLGSIIALFRENGEKVFEYSYDPWGNLRNPANNQVYPLSENIKTMLNRGFCGHEHLWWCGLINMNARLYDPSIGRFVSPDPYVQAPDFSQNFNRYSYCLNNPLKYTDTDGKVALLLVAGLIGATMNVAANWDNINGVGDFLKYATVGGVAGVGGAAVGAYVAGAIGFSGIAGGALAGLASGTTSGGILGLGNSIVDGASLNEMFRSTLAGALVGGASGALMGAASGAISSINNGTTLWKGEVKDGLQMQKCLSLSEPSEMPTQAASDTPTPNTIAAETMQSSTFPEGTGTNSVYFGTDKEGVVRYVGITERTPELRFNEHLNSLSPRSNLFFYTIQGTGNLSRIQARIIEQNLINTFQMGKNGGLLYNKINSISPRYWNRFGIIIDF